jgi:hypothetical protein
MNKKDAQKWLSYKDNGIKPSHYKTESIVYSDRSISKTVKITLKNYSVKLSPMDKGKYESFIDHSEKYPVAFICEVIADASVHNGGGNFDIPHVLDTVLTWLEFDYSVGMHYEQWEKFEAEWLKVVSPSISGQVQIKYPDLPKLNLQEIINLYERTQDLNKKTANKALSIKNNLKRGLSLKSISSGYSFLSFYKVIEMVSDHLASKKYLEADNETAKDLISFQLINKGSQRTKIYYLLKALDNTFSINEMIKLADIRNELAHADRTVKHNDLDNCQKLAFWVGEKFIKIVVSNSKA